MARACDGSTALHLAAYYGHVDASKVLLDCGADVHGKDKDGSSPLHNAAFKGNGAVLSLLIERGADVLAKQDSNGMTGLHLAAEGGYLEAIKLLLEAGADPTVVSSSGTSALDLALRSGGDASFDIAACLLSKVGGTRSHSLMIDSWDFFAFPIADPCHLALLRIRALRHTLTPILCHRVVKSNRMSHPAA